MVPISAIFNSTSLMRISITTLIGALISCLVFIGIREIEIGRLNKQIAALQKENNNLVVDNKILKENNLVLKENLKTLADANDANVATAKALLAERNKSVEAINNLAQSNNRNKEAFDRINKKLEELLSDPKNDGPVAPVLKDVIKEIQKERAKL